MMLNKSDSFEAGIPRYSLQPVGGRARILHAPSDVPRHRSYGGNMVSCPTVRKETKVGCLS